MIEKDREAGFADTLPGRDMFARWHQQCEQLYARNACSNMCHGTPGTGSVPLCPRRVMTVTHLYRHENNEQKT